MNRFELSVISNSNVHKYTTFSGSGRSIFLHELIVGLTAQSSNPRWNACELHLTTQYLFPNKLW